MIKYYAAGGLRIDYLITAERQVHLRQLGGNAVYAAVGARIWSPDVGILARVGEDYPPDLLRLLEESGLSTAGVRNVSGPHDMRTFYRYLDRDTRLDNEPARHFAELGLPLPEDLRDYVDSTPGQDLEQMLPLSIRPEDVPAEYGRALAMHIAPQGWSTQLALARELTARGLTVTLDPGEKYIKSPLARRLGELLAGVRAFLPSEQEVESLTGGLDLWAAAEQFAALGVPIVVVKAGSKGALLYLREDGSRWHIPAFPVQVIDVTGAGDAFCGGFMVGFQETGDPVQACAYGAVSASFVLEGYGALYALRATRAQAERRLGWLLSSVERL